MSEVLRVALAVEGPTDFFVLTSIIEHLLNGREFEPVLLQPLLSEAFDQEGGGGWGGVCIWCREAAAQAQGHLQDNPLLDLYDILLIQVDADVAEKRYSDDRRINSPPADLPCIQPCPPPSATTNALRKVALRWMGETAIPRKTVLCTPSKSLETWVLAALYPIHAVAKRPDLECHKDPEAPLRGLPMRERLIRGKKKDTKMYRMRASDVAKAWPLIRKKCSEAERFSKDLLDTIPVR